MITTGLAGAAFGIAAAESRLFGRPVIEALVVALLLGMGVRVAWRPGARFEPGVQFSAKQVLELAILLLGATVELPLLLRAGPALGVAIVSIVATGLLFGVGIGRALGLPPRLAILVACGNAICGNSAIAAVAPVIDAKPDDVASAIAFTAILSVVVVLGLPSLMPALGLTDYQYGVLAGLTVYAVPQVLAAAFPVSALSGQVATLVKLVRVLMLGPVVTVFAVLGRDRRAVADGDTTAVARPARRRRPTAATLVPWFIAGFLVLAGARAVGLVPSSWIAPLRFASSALTVPAMAALGLAADVRAVARAGTRVTAVVTASLAALTVLALGMIHVLRIR